jgi:hypothetical protein
MSWKCICISCTCGCVLKYSTHFFVDLEEKWFTGSCKDLQDYGGIKIILNSVNMKVTCTIMFSMGPNMFKQGESDGQCM